MSKEHEDEDDDDDNEEEEGLIGSNVKKHRRISGWNFSLDACQHGPVFPLVDSISGPSTNTSCGDEETVKQVAFSGESVVSENEGSSCSNVTDGGEGEVYIGGGSCVDKEVVMGSLMTLKKSLDDQREKVIYMLAVVGAEETSGGGGEFGGKEEKLMQVIEKLKLELENEKRKRTSLEMELEFLKLNITNTSDD